MANILLRQEQLPRTAPPPPAAQGAPIFLFLLAFFIFLGVTGGYGALTVLNKRQTDTRDTLKADVQQKEDDLNSPETNEIYLLEGRLKNLRNLITNHSFATNLFKLIEDKVHPQVRFDNFTFVGGSRKVEVSGEASDYVTLARQITILQNDPMVEYVEFEGLSLSNINKANFTLSVTIRPDLLSYKQQ